MGCFLAVILILIMLFVLFVETSGSDYIKDARLVFRGEIFIGILIGIVFICMMTYLAEGGNFSEHYKPLDEVVKRLEAIEARIK